MTRASATIPSRAASVVVADIGNTRIKIARVTESGALEPSIAVELADADFIERLGAFAATTQHFAWFVSSVNPPMAERLQEILESQQISARWYRSAADVPIEHALANPRATGADRALAVHAALGLADRVVGAPMIVALCGTAITAEACDATGRWLGGAIAPGLPLMAAALHQRTAQLPLVIPRHRPQPIGADTTAAVSAGLHAAAVGCLRELIAQLRGALDSSDACRVILTGGDADWLAGALGEPRAQVEHDLVLRGLAALAHAQTP